VAKSCAMHQHDLIANLDERPMCRYPARQFLPVLQITMRERWRAHSDQVTSHACLNFSPLTVVMIQFSRMEIRTISKNGPLVMFKPPVLCCTSLSLDALNASRRDEFRLVCKMPGANQPTLSHVHPSIKGTCKVCRVVWYVFCGLVTVFPTLSVQERLQDAHLTSLIVPRPSQPCRF
jgi:hypothetical protein